jgi:hypothetical protein
MSKKSENAKRLREMAANAKPKAKKASAPKVEKKEAKKEEKKETKKKKVVKKED